MGSSAADFRLAGVVSSGREARSLRGQDETRKANRRKGSYHVIYSEMRKNEQSVLG